LDFVFFTYVIALLGLAASIYAVLSVREVEKRLNSRNTKPQTKQPVPTSVVNKRKGHWD
jgi:Flp pilus assembly protein TadB